MGVIALEGMRFFGHHGVYQSEKKNGNEFIVDVYLTTSIDMAGNSDKLNQTIDYQQVYDTVSTVMTAPVNLLETLATKIIQLITTQHADVRKMTVRVSKMSPPVGGECTRSFVEESWFKAD